MKICDALNCSRYMQSLAFTNFDLHSLHLPESAAVTTIVKPKAAANKVTVGRGCSWQRLLPTPGRSWQRRSIISNHIV